MNWDSISDLLQSSFCVRLTETLLHFLWQGTAVALVAAVLFWRASSRVQYGGFVAALVLMLACPIVTFGLLPSPPVPAPTTSELPTVQTPAPPIAAEMPPPAPLPPAEAPDAPVIQAAPPVAAEPNSEPIVAAPAEATPVAATEEPVGWRDVVPYAAAGYLLGMLVMLVRLLLGLAGGGRLRRRSEPVDDVLILQALGRQAKALGMAFTPAVAYCRRVAVPTVVGILRPTILLPAGILTGLRPEQVELLLAHELAHVARLDHVVNLLQRVIEVVLFFHPAVWVVSRRIRIEREHCCDDRVLAVGGQKLAYAASLLGMAHLSRGRSVVCSAAALMATDRPSKLRRRIVRLFEGGTASTVRLKRSSILWVGLLAVAGLLVAAHMPGRAGEPESAPILNSSVQEILVGIRESDTRLGAYEVAYRTSVAWHSPIHGMVLDPQQKGTDPPVFLRRPTEGRCQWARRGAKFFYECVQRIDPRLRGKPVSARADQYQETVRHAFDGKRHIRHVRLAYIGLAYSVLAHSWNRGGIWPAEGWRRSDDPEMLTPDDCFRELAGRSIIDWLRKGKAAIRPERAVIAGTSCLIVDCKRPGGGKATFWISPVHGYRPLKMQLVQLGIPRHVYEVTKMKEAHPGVWFPMTASRKTFAVDPGTRKLELFRTVTLRVTADQLQVASKLPDSRFILKFSPGTKVDDRIQGRTYSTELNPRRHAETQPRPTASRPSGFREGFGIYLLKDQTLDLRHVAETRLAKLVLQEEPWIKWEDVERYDGATHWVHLREGVRLTWPKPSLHGRPFVVTADGQRCYMGTLWPVGSSAALATNKPLVYTPVGIVGPADVLPIEGKPGDRRGDLRIVQALKLKRQYHEGLKCSLDKVEVRRKGDSSSVRYTYTLTNADSDDLLVMDPDQMGGRSFHYWHIGPRFIRRPRDPHGPGLWAKATDVKASDRPTTTMTRLRSGQTMTRTVQCDGYPAIPPGEYDVLFTFRSPIKIEQADRITPAGRVWLGTAPATCRVTVGEPREGRGSGA